MSDALHKLVDRYCDVVGSAGTVLNGLNRAQLYMALKECGAETVLEMLEEIQKAETKELSHD